MDIGNLKNNFTFYEGYEDESEIVLCIEKDEALTDTLGGKPRPHSGRCNGDCANCPPHYVYRYSRWYYGHDHTHGCEFGGNKCGGDM